MFIFFDTTTSADETMDAIEEIRRVMGEQCFLSSMSSIATDTKNLVESEMAAYTIIAVILCLLVLFLTTDSFLIPVLFMVSIGMAILYNLGSNFIQGEISYITMALVLPWIILFSCIIAIKRSREIIRIVRMPCPMQSLQRLFR